MDEYGRVPSPRAPVAIFVRTAAACACCIQRAASRSAAPLPGTAAQSANIRKLAIRACQSAAGAAAAAASGGSPAASAGDDQFRRAAANIRRAAL
jgi:hypothetical protein